MVNNIYHTSLEAIAKIKTLEQWAYTLGYINAEYAHNFLTSEQYEVLFRLLELTKERLK